jgi:two-component system, NtrC family, sensor histidine kinase PilS
LDLLITDFLNYAKPEKTPTDKMNLKQVLEEVLYIVKNQTGSIQKLNWDIQLQDLWTLGYPEKLKQSFLNILINSVQALKDSQDAQIKLHLFEEKDFAVIKISDNGCGMSADNLKKMFEPFHTTKAKGTGLGLAITHKILELHQAQIDVQSEVGKGTDFIIKFNKK